MELFSAIPRHNQMDVLKKLDFKCFLKFKKCSKETVEITKNFRHPLHFEIHEIKFRRDLYSMKLPYGADQKLDDISNEPIRLQASYFRLFSEMSNEKFAYLKDFCKKTKLAISELQVNTEMKENEPWIIDGIIKLLKPTVLRTYHWSSSDFLRLKELQKIKRIIFSPPDMEESNLLLIKNTEIDIYHSRITASLVNKMLKQWMAGERTIKHLCVSAPEEYVGLFEDLSPTLLWSLKSTESELFAHRRTLIDQWHLKKVYALQRNDGKILCVLIGNIYGHWKWSAREHEHIEEIESWIQESLVE